jgi:hypothetical protein
VALEKAPLTADGLNDSVSADHLSFADSTDVFDTPALSEAAVWQSYGGAQSPIPSLNP